MNVMVPVGAPSPALAPTLAARATGWPQTEAAGLAVRLVVGEDGRIVWAKVPGPEAPKFPSPEKVTEIACVPGSSETWIEAAPPLREAVPRLAPPSENETVPVGVPAPGATAETVAVSVTTCPYGEDGALEETTTDEAALATDWLSAGDVLVAKLASPPYVALIEWPPTASADVVNVATPPEIVAVPSVVEPSEKVTVPVGDPVADEVKETLAEKVTGCPKTDGLEFAVTTVVVGTRATTRLKAWVTFWGVGEVESAIWTVNEDVPGAPEGVPERVPVPESVTPVGRLPAETLKT